MGRDIFDRLYIFRGIEKLLFDQEIHTSPLEIIREMKLPYIFIYDDESTSYKTGSMLVGKEYFDHYLNNKGLQLIETSLSGQELMELLDQGQSLMLELDLGEGLESLNYLSSHGDLYKFLDTRSGLILELEKDRLLDSLADSNKILYLREKKGDYVLEAGDKLLDSIDTLPRYKLDLRDYMTDLNSHEDILDKRDRIFYPFLVETKNMMELVGEGELARDIDSFRRDYDRLVAREEDLKLVDYLDFDQLEDLIDRYRNLLIEKKN